MRNSELVMLSLILVLGFGGNGRSETPKTDASSVTVIAGGETQKFVRDGTGIGQSEAQRHVLNLSNDKLRNATPAQLRHYRLA